MSQPPPWGRRRPVLRPTIFGKALGGYGQIKVQPRNYTGHRCICSSGSLEGARMETPDPRASDTDVAPPAPQQRRAPSNQLPRPTVFRGAGRQQSPSSPRRLLPVPCVPSSPATGLRLQRPVKFTIDISRIRTVNAVNNHGWGGARGDAGPGPGSLAAGVGREQPSTPVSLSWPQSRAPLGPTR